MRELALGVERITMSTQQRVVSGHRVARLGRCQRFDLMRADKVGNVFRSVYEKREFTPYKWVHPDEER
jgi:hypothetical protein